MFPGETAEQSQQFGFNGDRYGLTKRVDIERYNSEKKKLLEKQRSVDQISEKIKAIVAEIAPVTNKRKDLVLEQESIRSKIKRRKKVEQRISRWQHQIEELRETDFGAEKEKIKAKMKKASEEQVKLLKEWVSFIGRNILQRSSALKFSHWTFTFAACNC